MSLSATMYHRGAGPPGVGSTSAAGAAGMRLASSKAANKAFRAISAILGLGLGWVKTCPIPSTMIPFSRSRTREKRLFLAPTERLPAFPGRWRALCMKFAKSLLGDGNRQAGPGTAI